MKLRPNHVSAAPFLAVLAIALFAACATTGGRGTPRAAPSAETDGLSLEEGIARIARAIAAALPAGTRVAVVSCASPSERLSGYALDELQGALQNSVQIVVVERAQLDAVRRELNFQYAGEVDEASAVFLGKFLGAQTVIVGSLTPLGGQNVRVRFTAIDVETAVRKASPASTVRLDPARYE
jgi:curli biogenesis system outer membrane secretion channel CsgG